METDPALPSVLILGGSTFMGRETVLALLARPARVCVVNRGRKYWGTRDPSGGRTIRVSADRNRPREFATCLDEATSLHGGGRWALVVDFSAFSGRDMHAALAGLRGRFDLYVYISSDSIYEVSSWAADGWHSSRVEQEAERVTEQAGVRPVSYWSRWRLWFADSYGHGKLEAEEVLAAGLSEEPAAGRGVALRLPDVIGPFDDTLRLWAYWHWVQLGPKIPVQVPEEMEGDTPLALVFSQDIARFIAGLVGSSVPLGVPQFDAVNLACARQPTLAELLTLLAEVSGLSGPPAVVPSASPSTLLPSVARPWRLCCQHIVEDYNFVPTGLEEALRVCAEWFASADSCFPAESESAAEMLPDRARESALARIASQESESSSSSSASDED